MTLKTFEHQPVIHVRAADDGQWIFEGIAVPYGQTISHGGYREEFAKGAFSEYRGGATLYGQHGHLKGEWPIGLIESAEERDDGLHVRGKISKTARGTEAYTLLKDRVLQSLSVGFAPELHEIRSDDLGEIVVYTRADLREVSIVGMPAYSGAVITDVRNADTPSADSASANTERADMADNDILEIRQGLEDLTRSFELLKTAGAGSADKGNTVKYRSLGEFVKGLATGESRKDAESLHGLLTRAADATGPATTTNANVQVAWIDRDVKLVEAERTVLELFAKGPLPAEGMVVEYPQFGSRSGDVAEQGSPATIAANVPSVEGANLTYLEIEFTDASAPVKTYGGYSALSRQAIERASVAYLDAVLRNQRISYARTTNAAVRNTLTLAANLAAYNNIPTGSLTPSAAQWTDAAVNGANEIATKSQGLTADVWLMGFAQFRQLATLADTTGRPIFSVNGDGVNTFGSVDVRGVKAVVGGIPVVVDGNLTGTDSFILSRNALTVLEDGAKYLQDENIINLTREFSIYGYMALTLNDLKGVTRVRLATA